MTLVRRTVLANWLLIAMLAATPAALRAQAVASPSAPATSSTTSGERSTPEAQSPDKNGQEKDENEAYRHSASVVRLGGMVGMNPDQSATAFELVNLLILGSLLVWAIMKLIPGAIRARNSAIQKHLVDARTATEEAGARLSSVEARLGKLDAQIAALHAEAEQESIKDEARIKASAEDEKQRILAAAEQEIASATMQAHKHLQQYAAELAIEQAARKLVVSAETDRLLVQRFAQRLGGDESKKGQN